MRYIELNWNSFVREFIRDNMTIREILNAIVLLSSQTTRKKPQEDISLKWKQTLNKAVTCCIFGFTFDFTYGAVSRVSIHTTKTTDTCTVYLGFFVLCIQFVHQLDSQEFYILFQCRYGKSIGKKIKRNMAK